MIKKLLNDILKLSLILLICSIYIIEPLEVAAASKATTIAGLREELAKLKQEKIDNANAVKSTQGEISAKKNAIYNAYKDQEKAQSDIEAAEIKIEEINGEIETTTKQIEDLLKTLQIMQGENAYLEYISGSSSVTEMVMRTKAVDQITNYSKNQIDKMHNLIEENRQLQKDLENKKIELEGKISSYQSAVSSLGNQLSALAEITEDIDDQIKNQEALINYYSKICTSETQLLSRCSSVAVSFGWLRPLNKGSVTSNWGYRYIFGSTSFHNGIDLGGNSEGTNIYSAANGTVAAITRRSRCGGNKVYIHVNVNGKAYTTYYFHLLSINVNVGDNVTTNTVIGTVGGGKGTRSYDTCTTGAHLHFGVSTGYYLKDYSAYSTLTSRSTDPAKTVGFPSKGTWFYKRS